MNCPHCHKPSLVETMTKGSVLVDVCKTCMTGNDITCYTSCKLRGAG